MRPGPWLAGAVACHHHLVTVDRVRLVTVFLALERGTMIFVGHKVGNLSHKTFCGLWMSHKTHRQQQDERRATGVEVGLAGARRGVRLRRPCWS